MRTLAISIAVLLAVACAPAPNAADLGASAEARPAPAATASASAATSPASGARPLDELFRAWSKQLPEAATVSEQNGASIPCAGQRYATLTLLVSTARKVPLEGAPDLVALVPWARHADPCIRQIALQALVPAIGYDRNALSVPPMHDVEHHQFHDVLFSLHAKLVVDRAAFAPALFDGMRIGEDLSTVVASLRGKWVEDSGSKGFQLFVDVDDERIVVTNKHVPPDPKWDSTWTTHHDRGTLNDRGQYVVRGAWSVETHDGHDNPRQAPSPFVLSFWPVARDVVWFKNGESAYWEKMRRR